MANTPKGDILYAGSGVFSSLTATRIVYVGTNGLLTDSANLTYAGGAVIVGAQLGLGPGSITDSSGAISFATANLTTTGTMQSGRNLQGATWHAYGGFENQAETIGTAAATPDFVHITNAGTDLWNLDEADGITEAADVFTLTNTGDYFGSLTVTLSAVTGKDFNVRVYNNTQTRIEGRAIGASTTGTGNKTAVTIPLYIEGTAGDEIQFEVACTSASDVDIDDALFILTYLHD